MTDLLDRNIALIGFMAAGKTQVGAALSRRSGLPFVDVDALVESLEQAPVHRIFREKGEAYFRRLETIVLRNLCEGSGAIIGCGGGTVLAEENRRMLHERCILVWLRVSGGEVLDRLARPDSPRRPVLEGLDPARVVPDLLRAREPWYEEADFKIETDGRSVEDIAEEISLRLGLAPLAEGSGGSPGKLDL